MTVIVQQPTDSNGNPQPMVYDSDTGKIIVDSNGYVINGGKRLVNVPTVSEYVNTPKTQTSGIQEAKEALPRIWNQNSSRYVPSGKIILRFGNRLMNISKPIIIYDDEFVELTTEDAYATTFPSTSSDYSKVTNYITNTTSTSIIQILRNPSNVTGWGRIILTNFTVINTYSAPVNSFPLVYCGPDTYSTVYVPDTSTDPNPSTIFLDKLNIVDNVGNQPLLYLTTPGFEQLFDIGDIFLYGTSGNYNMMTVAASHIKGGYWYIESDGSSAAPTVNGTGLMLVLQVGQDCHITTFHFNFDGNGILYSTGLGSQQGAMPIIDVIRDEMETIDNNGLDGNGNAITMGSTTGLIIGYYSGSATSVPLGVSVLASDSNFIVIREFPQFRGFTNPNNIFLTPSISANPPVSGTAYQNTNPYNIRLKIPITYNPSTTEAATLATGISANSTISTSTKVSLPSGLTAADGQILTYDMVVPAGWYYELVVANATIGTAEIEAA